MRETFIGHLAILCSIVVLSCESRCLAQDGPSQEIIRLIQGAVGRSSAVTSLKLKYRYRSEAFRKRGEDPVTERMDLAITVRGNDWIVKYGDSANFRMKRNQASVKYYEVLRRYGDDETSQDEGVTTRQSSLHLIAAETYQSLIHEHACHAGPRLGTFWFPEQAAFIEQQQLQVVDKGTEHLGPIETHVLEWDVAALDLDAAMVLIPDEIARSRRGKLRIYIAPKLGYALPRIEYATLEGKVVQQFEASQFVPVNASLFFPREALCRTVYREQADVSRFEISEITDVNQEISDGEFSINVPELTYVRDSRPGVPVSVFQLKSQEQLDQINGVLENAMPAPGTTQLRRVLLWLNALALVIVLGYWVRKRCRKH